MYYKDDFYKEFRTEKELCEYLEEIDSRAEWIRITSKKLKVAAAGEETCTEVPGISLEALDFPPQKNRFCISELQSCSGAECI